MAAARDEASTHVRKRSPRPMELGFTTRNCRVVTTVVKERSSVMSKVDRIRYIGMTNGKHRKQRGVPAWQRIVVREPHLY